MKLTNVIALALLTTTLGFAKGKVKNGGIIKPSTKANDVQQMMIKRKFGMFIHFGINTFHNMEWTAGDKPASSYNPTNLDTDQWVRTARDAGMKYVIFTAKHHEGFCLWDSKYTDYDVASSPVKTDVVRSLARSCKKYGLKLGIYYSLWDRHESSYRDHKKYVQYMKKQLTELLSNYGPICELWFDGGWSKKREEWDIPRLYATIKKLQPACAVGINWSIGKPGNPDFHAVMPKDQKEGYPFRYFPADFRLGDPKLPANPDPKIFTNEGDSYYMPFESTVCLNKRWFFHTGDKFVKSVEELERVYKIATSQDNILILNSPPNREGRMTEANVKRLKELAKELGLKPVRKK